MSVESACNKFYENNYPRGFEDLGYPDNIIESIRDGKFSHMDYIRLNLFHGEDNIKNGEFRWEYLECAPPLYAIPAVIEDADKHGMDIWGSVEIGTEIKSQEIIEKVSELFSLISSPKTDLSKEYDSKIDELAADLAKISTNIISFMKPL